MAEGDIDEMLAAHRFPIGDPIGDSRFRCYQHLAGTQAQQLYLARRTYGSPDRFLVSMIAAADVPVDKLRRDLAYRMAGILEIEYLGYFDRHGASPERDRLREQHCTLVERLPATGDWLPTVTTTAFGPARAAALGASVGAILYRASEGGLNLVGVRPDFIWAEGDAVTGLTGRNYELFAHCNELTVSAALFRRSYYAPEVYLGKPHDSRALVFTLATMIAEWATGAYPFPTSWVGGSMHSLCEGRHAALDLPPPLRELLERSLRREPDQRVDLGDLTRALGRLGSGS